MEAPTRKLIKGLTDMVQIYSIRDSNHNEFFKINTIGLLIKMDKIRAFDIADLLDDIFKKLDVKISEHYRPMSVFGAWFFLTEPNTSDEFIRAYNKYPHKESIDSLIAEIGLYAQKAGGYFQQIETLVA
jgi:hypothetical protein